MEARTCVDDADGKKEMGWWRAWPQLPGMRFPRFLAGLSYKVHVSYVQRIAKLSSLIYNHSTFVDLADTSSAPKSLKDT